MANKEEIIEKLIKGEIKLHEIESYTGDVQEAIEVRREFAEQVAGSNLSHLSQYSMDLPEAMKRNIENPIGTVQIPVGLAGPLHLNGEYAQGTYYVPLATSEGALVASINRGCSVTREVGGANVHIIDDKMTRAPVIQAESAAEALKIKEWIERHFIELKEAAESTTRHGRLLKIDPVIVVGRYVYPRFTFTTGDSMGMNMVTIATDKAMDI